MTSNVHFCHILGIKEKNFSKKENQFLEIDFFFRILNELNIYFTKKSSNPKTLSNKENIMFENNAIQEALKDMIITDEYDISGIARYTYTTPDVILDILAGYNKYPSLTISRKIIELHRIARRDLYIKILNKILTQLRLETTFLKSDEIMTCDEN